MVSQEIREEQNCALSVVNLLLYISMLKVMNNYKSHNIGNIKSLKVILGQEMYSLIKTANISRIVIALVLETATL